MSIPVPLLRLRAAVDERDGSAYLLTVSDDGSPHAVHAPVRWEGEVLVAEVGEAQRRECHRAAVSVLFPVRGAGDYSLIVDGTATVTSGDGARRMAVAPARAVLHRPAVVSDPAAPCAADCVPVLRFRHDLTAARRGQDSWRR